MQKKEKISVYTMRKKIKASKSAEQKTESPDSCMNDEKFEKNHLEISFC